MDVEFFQIIFEYLFSKIFAILVFFFDLTKKKVIVQRVKNFPVERICFLILLISSGIT